MQEIDQKRTILKLTAIPESFYKSSRTAGVYGLRDPLTGRIRYIGESDHIERRYYTHVNSSRQGAAVTSVTRLQKSWIRNLRSVGMRPELVVLQVMDGSSKQDRLAAEDQIIDLYRDLLGEADLNLKCSGRSAAVMLKEFE